ncbi:hypothetical protein TREPR_1629 [Treponema primitia ZAS-2]|uniref:Uncharacterized protein n=1 Tax=Treponema primitia (strain ATCC BAA-887 / DSM 12427 / ZAS-2) TaxID=545694 RepID=F5YNR4_TREPZ|nr:hypothetical protein TREPR_1629 [Treponema primitia ZAS-2]
MDKPGKILYHVKGLLVNILVQITNKFIRKINILSGKASEAIHRFRWSPSPMADRLLADALRLAEIPSPTHQEEQRTAFVLERLGSLGIQPQMDEYGNILVKIPTQSPQDGAPLLLFSDIGSTRWHPLESLSRLDSVYARGAGLADILGCAALLSAAESLTGGQLKCDRDVLLLFTAHALDDPEGKAFFPITENHRYYPCAAIGLRGLSLGTVIAHTQGIYRIRINVSRERPEKDPGKEEADSPAEASAGSTAETANQVVNSLIATARKLSSITWDSQGITRFYIRRIEAGSGFDRTPGEGVLEIELESSDGAQLDMAMNTLKATAEHTPAAQGSLPGTKSPLQKGNPGEIKTEVTITSFIPVGEQNVNGELLKTLRSIMKDLRIRCREENGADPSAILSNRGIPSFSLGIAQGWEGLNSDTIDIASIERGRQLIEAIITRIHNE